MSGNSILSVNDDIWGAVRIAVYTSQCADSALFRGPFLDRRLSSSVLPSIVCQSFNDGLSYALSQLGMPDLTLKAEQVQRWKSFSCRLGSARVFAAFS